MSMGKKPRTKKHIPRRISVPMMFLTSCVLEKYPTLATSMYGQIIAFCEMPSFETSNNLARQLASIAGGMSHMFKGGAIRGRCDAGSIAISSAIHCVESIINRYERTGAIQVTDKDKQTLHAAAGRLDGVLQTMPLACYQRGYIESSLWLKEAKEPQDALL